jgi:hypothetical protein
MQTYFLMEAWIYDDGTVMPKLSLPGIGHLSYGDATKCGGKDPYEGVKLVQAWYTKTGRDPTTNVRVSTCGYYRRISLKYEGPLKTVVEELSKVNKLREARGHLFDEEKIREIDTQLAECMHGLDQPLCELRKLTDTLGRA